MTQEVIKRIHRIYGWVTAALIGVTAIMLIVGCVQIFQQGENPFTVDRVSAVLLSIAPLGWTCAAAVVGGFVLSLALPLNEGKSMPSRDTLALLKRYQHKDSELPREILSKAHILRKARKIRNIACFVFGASLSLIPICYFADPAHFQGANVMLPLSGLLPGLLVLVFVYIVGVRNLRSIEQEIALYKDLSIKPGKTQDKRATESKKLWILRVAVLTIALVFILLGIGNKGFLDVLGKAIRICTECIGLG